LQLKIITIIIINNNNNNNNNNNLLSQASKPARTYPAAFSINNGGVCPGESAVGV